MRKNILYKIQIYEISMLHKKKFAYKNLQKKKKEKHRQCNIIIIVYRGSFIITSIIYSVFTTVYRMILHNFYVIDRIFSIETLIFTHHIAIKFLYSKCSSILN